MRHFALLIALGLLNACTAKKEPIVSPNTKILHLSHTRSDEAGKVSEKLAAIDFFSFDVLCLGGDLDLDTSADSATLQVWDDLFHLGEPSTLWALGNHDVSHRPLIGQFTGRPAFYAWTERSVTFLVLDTQADASQIIGDQLAFLQTVTDTISESKQLIVLTHKLIWMYGNSDLEDQIDQVANGELGSCDYCTNPNNFYADVYPRLLEVRNRGIGVYCIAGDIGFRTSSFEYLTPDGIHFLASGIDVNKEDNLVLLLELDDSAGLLDWQFKPLQDL